MATSGGRTVSKTPLASPLEFYVAFGRDSSPAGGLGHRPLRIPMTSMLMRLASNQSRWKPRMCRLAERRRHYTGTLFGWRELSVRGRINLPRQAEVIAATFHTCVVLLCTWCTDRDHRCITITIVGYEYTTYSQVLVRSRTVNSRTTERFIRMTAV